MSTTRHPAAANLGASSAEVPPPAENSASAGLRAMASSADITVHSFPRKETFRPTDLAEATGNSSVTGKFLSSSNCNILVPTSPVAPTTATFMVLILKLYKNKKLI